MVRRVKKRCKNAVLASQVVLIIAALFALLIFVTKLTVPITAIANAQNIIQKCHLSVARSSWQWDYNNWVVDYNIVDSPFGFDCETIFTEIKKDGIKTAGEGTKFKDDNYGEQTKSQLKEAIMNNMKDCWYMYGEGKTKVQQAISVNAYETACIVCSDIIVDKKFNEKEIKGLALEDIYTYAATTTMPNSDKTYLDYFLEGAIKPEEYPGNGVNDDSAIILGGVEQKNQQYSVVFAVANSPDVTEAGLPVTKLDFGWDSIIKQNSGIVGCYAGSEEAPGYVQVTNEHAADSIGCRSNSNSGVVFGRVAEGIADFDTISSEGERGQSVVGFGLLSSIKKTFPMTVRLVPTSELANSCERLY